MRSIDRESSTANASEATPAAHKTQYIDPVEGTMEVPTTFAAADPAIKSKKESKRKLHEELKFALLSLKNVD